MDNCLTTRRWYWSSRERIKSIAVIEAGRFRCLEYSSRGTNGFVAQRRNLVRPSHLFLFREIVRFNREAPALLDAPDAEDQTLDMERCPSG